MAADAKTTDGKENVTKALFFDLDGTISDTDAIHLANWLELLRPHGIDVDMDLYGSRYHSGNSVRQSSNKQLRASTNAVVCNTDVFRSLFAA